MGVTQRRQVLASHVCRVDLLHWGDILFTILLLYFYGSSVVDDRPQGKSERSGQLGGVINTFGLIWRGWLTFLSLTTTSLLIRLPFANRPWSIVWHVTSFIQCRL